MEEWFYTKMGLQQGPVPKNELLGKIRRGDISETSLIWREGMADWLPVSQIPELQQPQPQEPAAPTDYAVPPPMPSAPMETPPAPAPQQLDHPVGNVPLQQPPAFQGNYVAPDVPSYLVPSIIAMVLSALSMMLFCLAPGVITGIVAIVYASKVDGLKAQGEYIAAVSASKTAKIWMIVTYALLGLPVLGVLGFIVFAALQ